VFQDKRIHGWLMAASRCWPLQMYSQTGLSDYCVTMWEAAETGDILYKCHSLLCE